MTAASTNHRFVENKKVEVVGPTASTNLARSKCIQYFSLGYVYGSDPYVK